MKIEQRCSLEHWVKTHLNEKQELTELLAEHNSLPAIFYQEGPDDTSGWKDDEMYPQLHFMITKEEADEGYQEGIIKFRVLCEKENNLSIEVEQVLRNIFKDSILQTDEDEPMYLTWSKTKALKQKEKQDLASNITGLRVYFNLIEYPSQENMDPDPVQALFRYIGSKIPDAVKVGQSNSDGIHYVDEMHPGFYIRFDDVKITEETNTVIWMEGKLSVHVIAVSPSVRLKWMMLLLKQLTSSGEIEMLDHSPMWIQDIEMNSRADYRREGQLEITVRYGLPKYDKLADKLASANFTINS